MELSTQELGTTRCGRCRGNTRERQKEARGRENDALDSIWTERNIYIIFTTHYLGYYWIQPINIEFIFLNCSIMLYIVVLAVSDNVNQLYMYT